MDQRMAWRKKRKQYEIDQYDLMWIVDGKDSENFYYTFEYKAGQEDFCMSTEIQYSEI